MFTSTTMFVLFFFFQAEDGIRDTSVTGVKTCALPILALLPQENCPADAGERDECQMQASPSYHDQEQSRACGGSQSQIGRASCRERVQISDVARSVKRKRETQAYTLHTELHAKINNVA